MSRPRTKPNNDGLKVNKPEPEMHRLLTGDKKDQRTILIIADKPDRTAPRLPSRYRMISELGRGTYSLGNICFQQGSVPMVGRNGASEDALLHILRSRFSSHQLGPYPSDSNEACIRKIDELIELCNQRRQENTQDHEAPD